MNRWRLDAGGLDGTREPLNIRLIAVSELIGEGCSCSAHEECTKGNWRFAVIFPKTKNTYTPAELVSASFWTQFGSRVVSACR